jgi:predicted regulator of Ras-like GTPase activity (Roadblock/LC7/MglB family)
MSKIHDAIAELHRLPGVKASALVTNDGLVAAESLDQRFPSDVVAGLTSYLLMTTNRCLEEGKLGKASQIVVQASNGKAILTTLDDACLVVLLDQFADATQAKKDVQEAAQRIRRLSRIA